MLFEFSEDDLAVGKLVDVGWHQVAVHKVIETADKDGADLVKVQMKINGEGEYKGVILYTQFSEKGKGFARPFVEAITGKSVEKGDKVNFGPTMVGRELEVYVQRGEYRGKPKNDVVDYRPIQRQEN